MTFNADDPILYVDVAAGKLRPGKYIATYGSKYVIELTVRGKPVLRYAAQEHVLPATSSGEHHGQ